MLLKRWYLSLECQENIVEEGENAGYQHFLLFPQCFQMPFFCQGRENLEMLRKRGKPQTCETDTDQGSCHL